MKRTIAVAVLAVMLGLGVGYYFQITNNLEQGINSQSRQVVALEDRLGALANDYQMKDDNYRMLDANYRSLEQLYIELTGSYEGMSDTMAYWRDKYNDLKARCWCIW